MPELLLKELWLELREALLWVYTVLETASNSLGKRCEKFPLWGWGRGGGGRAKTHRIIYISKKIHLI